MARKRTKKADKPDANQGNNIAEFTKERWQAAVNLRGPIEPADYKRYGLPIIFLRFCRCGTRSGGRSWSG